MVEPAQKPRSAYTLFQINFHKKNCSSLAGIGVAEMAKASSAEVSSFLLSTPFVFEAEFSSRTLPTE
jgi:hypothetical protein